ncbi:MAG: acetyl-CoA carboxylase biotin carboxyl carrier protein [Rhodobacter sp.]|nr:acetyl-CoA carboxylase biotin carboxyl carrier protein [Rhodobacter sp.]
MTLPDNDTDIAFVQALAAVLRDNDLAELEVERGSKSEGRLSVRLLRPSAAPAPAPTFQHAAPPAAPAPQASPVPAAEPAAAPPDDPASLPGVVTSPMVGTVYLQAEPGSPPFVKIGDEVSEGQTLLIVEAMKTMNHIHAAKAGKVTRIFVEDGAPVEFGAPLMVVE